MELEGENRDRKRTGKRRSLREVSGMPDTPPYRKRPGDRLGKMAGRTTPSNSTQKTPRSARRNWTAWTWGTLCVATWILYAAEYLGLYGLHDLLTGITTALNHIEIWVLHVRGWFT